MPKPASRKEGGEEQAPLTHDLLRKTLSEHFGCAKTCARPICSRFDTCNAIALGDGRPCDSPNWNPDYERLAERLYNLYRFAFEKEPPNWGLLLQEGHVTLNRIIARGLKKEQDKEAGRRRRRNGRPPIPPEYSSETP